LGRTTASCCTVAGRIVAMIPFHPLADIFPLIEGDDFDQLVADIRDNGLREPIVLLEGQILDGRNRYRACVAAGLMPEELTAPGRAHLRYFHSFVPAGFPTPPHDGLLAYVISKNLRRRQLNDDQRRMVAARLVNLKQGRPADDKTSQIANISRGSAAKMLTSDVAGIDRARSVISRAVPELIAAVDQGVVSVASAAELAAQPVERQAEIVNALPRDEHGRLTPAAKKALAPVIKEVRAEKQIEKKERRDTREAELGRRLREMPEKHFGVAIEDFEWDHKPWSRETGMDRHPANHYPTAADAHTPEEIVARTAERFKCLADDCVLYMWTTIPHEAIAHRVLELRGFKYVTQRIWSKLRSGNGRGPGYWVTGEHEILLIGVRGKVVPPATAHFRSLFEAPVGEHSQKPDQQYEHAEFHFPNLPKIELNARRARPGWQRWGNEAPLPLADDAETQKNDRSTGGHRACCRRGRPGAPEFPETRCQRLGGLIPAARAGDVRMSAIAEDHFLQINSCSFARAETIVEYYVWLSSPHGLGQLLFFGDSGSSAVDFAAAIAERYQLLISNRLSASQTRERTP
jgi:N6-adenosine-specific RNA methylase IME4/ParB-like chromosome segregation protein Spo0J